ncbi:HMCN1 [Branchiostoma lanceolatum]|uniref:HMCN1 protein n=1 Tax=Branchiostoma lanceolatum TaxID=7740 RepID=A0A8J9VXH9_BRALA|nr:HMCN1 [Branchiostoma lanceolatum]
MRRWLLVEACNYDECSAGDHHCSQLCNNTAGGYSCYCGEGYYTDEEKDHLCLDIDECFEGTDNCTDLEVCGNDPGSFHCNCTEDAVLVGGTCVPGNVDYVNLVCTSSDYNTNDDDNYNNDTDHQCQHNYGTHYFYNNNVHYYSASNPHHHYYYCSSIHSWNHLPSKYKILHNH